MDPLNAYIYVYVRGYTVAQLVEALRYKPEGRGFDSHGSSHPCSHKYSMFPGDRYPKLEIYISDLILYSYESVPLANVKMRSMI